MELRHLRYFIAVAEAGAFSAAAAEIHVSQPSLSVAIGQLESEFGTALFVRGGRGVRLTSAGRHFLEEAYRVVDDVDSLHDRFTRFNRGETGQIRLAAVPALIWSRVPAFLRVYGDGHPEVEVHLFDPHPLGAIEMVLARTADIALIVTADNHRLSMNYRGVLDFVPWGDLELVAVFPGDEVVPERVDLSVMNGRTVYVPRRVIGVPSLGEVVDEALATRGIRPRVTRTISSSIPMTLPLIAAGLGAGILPANVLGEGAFAGLTTARIEPPLRRLDVAAVWRSTDDVSPAVTAMKTLLATGAGIAAAEPPPLR